MTSLRPHVRSTARPMPRSVPNPMSSQRGVTLVELMVALVIGLFIALAAAAALVVARQGFTAVDSGGQLRENARFAADLMQRIVVQAGFEDVANGSYDRQFVYGTVDDPKWPGILGYDNAWYAGGDPAAVVSDSRPGGCGFTDTSCNNYSDIVVVRFQGTSNATGADGGMIDCAGFAEPYRPAAGARAWSVFHVIRTNDGEPSLACSYIDPADGVTWKTQTLVKGVEGFQVMYGTDGATSATAPPASSNGMHGTVNRYLSAKDLTVSGNAQATQDNWRRVRTLRIALLFRGDVASMATRETRTWDMRGGSGFAAANDSVGDSLAVPADGRLRQNMIFTVHLRNQQGYDVCTSSVTAC